VSPARIAVLLALVACDAGEPPDLLGLSDQIAVVGQEFVLELRGVDPDGDRLSYSFATDAPLQGRATMTRAPSGNGVFRWTPVAADVGSHVVDFIASDGSHDTDVPITIEVRATAAGIPVFVEPTGTGRVVNLATDPCVDLDVIVQDEDTPQLTIAQEEPKIDGATLDQLDGSTAHWRWCPTSAQVADSNRYTLVLSAADDTSKTTKNYVLVVGGVPPSIVINEIDYDNTSLDQFEYVEIFNPNSTTMSLAGLYLVFVNGATSAEYDAVYLGYAGSLAPGAYLLIGGAGVDVPTSVQKIDPGWTTDAIQNGAPDGAAIIDDITLTVLDAVSYEGSITAASIIGFTQPVSLVEGQALPASTADSDTTIMTLCRMPNGVDTNNAASDWTTCKTRTKAAANAL
jgi:hypothetical protein